MLRIFMLRSAILTLAVASMLLQTHPVFADGGGGTGPAPPIATISDQYPVNQVIQPPNQGPPAPNYANVTFAETVVTSWYSEIRFWEPGYTPQSINNQPAGADTGGDETPYQFDSANGDNAAGKTDNVGVGANEMFQPQVGKQSPFCFHTHGYGANGLQCDAYTGIQYVIQ